jgi:ribokinase
MTMVGPRRRGPIVVVGAHLQSLFMHVESVAREGESVLGWGYNEPLDGGKATNQAFAAARLGAPVAFVSIVGDDRHGRRVMHELGRAGVDVKGVEVVQGPTDLGFVMLPPSGIPGIVSAQQLSLLMDPEFVNRASTAIERAGVVVCQLEAPLETARAAFSLARRRGAITILNPSPAREIDPELRALVDVLVPNEHEAATLVGYGAAPDELAAALALTWAPATVIVTAGALGAWVALPGAIVRRVPAPDVAAVDTTGAGDAFIGALATRLRVGSDLDGAVEYAVAAASISVTRAGTIPAFPTAAEVRTALHAAANPPPPVSIGRVAPR